MIKERLHAPLFNITTDYSSGIPKCVVHHAHPDEKHEHCLRHAKDLSMEHRHPLGLQTMDSSTWEQMWQISMNNGES